MAYVPNTVAKTAASDFETLALQLPLPGQRWKREDWTNLNRMITIATTLMRRAAVGDRKTDQKR
jgi:hypothetical protein